MRMVLIPCDPLPTLSTPCVPVIYADTQGPQTPWYDWVGQRVQWFGQAPLARCGPAGSPPWGVGWPRGIGVGTSNFSTKNVTTRFNRHPPQSSDVSHNLSEVDIGVYG